MSDNISNILKYVLWGLIGSSLILTALYYLDWGVTESTLIIWGYILLGVTTVLALVFPIVILVQDPKKAKGAVISLVGLLFVLGIGYVLASDAVSVSYEELGVDANTSRLVGMGIIATYILLIVSVTGIIVFGVINTIKS